MPLTQSGKKALANMMSEYGGKKGKKVFYASINKGKKGTDKWHTYVMDGMKKRAKS